MSGAEKYPRVGCARGYFVDAASVQVARGRLALFNGLTTADGSPIRTAAARLVGSADSVAELRQAYPQAFADSSAPLSRDERRAAIVLAVVTVPAPAPWIVRALCETLARSEYDEGWMARGRFEDRRAS